MADSVNTTSIETILQLRNDTKDNWDVYGANTTLMPGEAAVEINNGKVKIKVGSKEGDTFATAPYVGGEDAQVFQNTTPEPAGSTRMDEEVITELVGNKELHDGDVAIIKRYFDKDTDDANYVSKRISYTSYVYSVANGWEAMDGNYDANNVYFRDDITLAGDYKTVGNISKSSSKIAAAGKSLSEIFAKIFTQENNPTRSEGIDATFSATTSNGEVGSTFSAPIATFKFTKNGKYSVDSVTQNANCKIAVGAATIAEGAIATSSNKKTNTSEIGRDGTLSITGASGGTYGDTAVTFGFNVSATYSDGAIPKTNIGNNYDEDGSKSVRILSGTITKSATATFTGWRYVYGGGTTAATIDSAAIRALKATMKSNANKPAKNSEFVFKALKGDTKVIFAFPSTWTTSTPKFEMMTTKWDTFTGGTFNSSTVSVAGYGGTGNTTNYTVYTFSSPEPFDAAETQFRVSF